MRLVLWDIDGTLLRAGPVGRDIFSRAVAHVVGRDPGEHGIAMSGKTDPQIAMEILESMAVAKDALDGYLPAILDRLEAELAAGAAALRADGQVLPGVPELLARLDAEPAIVQSVLTGNIAVNAAAKLAAFDLQRWFDWRLGAFGSDHHDRRTLVGVALERLRRHHRHEPDEVWVIGDTPNDLACARAGGARCLLVATGRIPYDELRRLGADAVRRDLSDVDDALRLLLGRSARSGHSAGVPAGGET